MPIDVWDHTASVDGWADYIETYNQYMLIYSI
jgi:hypothetical protein